LAQFLGAIFIAGFMVGCRALDDGEPLELGHLFAGFRERAGSLILVSVIMLGLAIALAVILAIFMLGGIAALMAMGPSEILGAGLLFVLVLVILEEKSAIEAMKGSFLACLKNFVPFLIYGVCGLLLGLVAMIPLGLGLLVFIPTMTASMYASFKDIHYDQ
jgi:uncharacterized membrane protein